MRLTLLNILNYLPIKSGRPIFIIIFISIFLLFSYAYGQGSDIEKLKKSKMEIESITLNLSKQYKDITSQINQIKSRKSLNLLEEAELLNLMAQAQTISNQLEKNYKELDRIESELSKLGVDVGAKKSDVLRLKIVENYDSFGPVELKEKALLLKEKEERLKKEIQRLIETEKKMRLRDEANAFIKEQSLFDEDSVLAVVKKNVRSVAESSSSLPQDEKKGDTKNSIEVGYDSSSTTSPTFSEGGSPQDIKIKIEVTYEKSGLMNQTNVRKDNSYIIDIDLNATSPEELANKIEMLKKVYEELAMKRVELEKRAKEVEIMFKEKKK